MRKSTDKLFIVLAWTATGLTLAVVATLVGPVVDVVLGIDSVRNEQVRREDHILLLLLGGRNQRDRTWDGNRRPGRTLDECVRELDAQADRQETALAGTSGRHPAIPHESVPPAATEETEKNDNAWRSRFNRWAEPCM